MKLIGIVGLAAAVGAWTVVQVPSFEPVQPDLFATGASFLNAWADIDGDGDLDLFVGFNGAPNRLYRNDAGVFVDVAASAGLAEARAVRAAAWADMDRDGDPDLLVGYAPGKGSVLRLFRNDARARSAAAPAEARFVDATDAAGLAIDSGAVRQMSWIDVDGDRDLDLFVAFRDRANALWRNDEGRFTDVAPAIGLADTRKTVGAVWFDFDEDDDLDVYVGNMDGDKNGLFRNDGGRFTDVAEAHGLAWGGREPGNVANGTVRPCAADVNGDGHLDLFMANYGTNGLFLNLGGGRFEDVSVAWGAATDARHDTCAFADFDNDGRLDLYVNGTVTGGVNYPDYLLHNTGAWFGDVTPPQIRASQGDHGAQWADYDRDGDLDLALTGAAMHSLFRNALAPAPRARSLHVRVVDAEGHACCAGAEVRVFAAGTRGLLGTRLVDSGSGYNSQNDMPVHFGFAVPGRVDLEVLPRQAGSRVVRVRNIDPRSYAGRELVVRVPR